MPSTLRLDCASCGESAAVLNPSTRSIVELACPACGERGKLGENPNVAFAPVEPFPALAEPEPLPPPISTRTIIARRKRGSGLAFLVRMAIVVALGGVLADWIWQQIGAPRIELHRDVDGSMKEIRVVPTR